MFVYVIPNLNEDLIVGQPWKREENAVVDPNKNMLHLKYERIDVVLLSERDTVPEAKLTEFQLLVLKHGVKK